MSSDSFAPNVASVHKHRFASLFRHFGVFGLFTLAVLDSSPLPTFAGTDLLTAILAATHRGPWYEYAAVATAGSVIGAYLTFRVARKAGSTYLERSFKRAKIALIVRLFDRWGSGALALSTAVPLPFPTSALFVAAGASRYRTSSFVTLVTICRAARYTAIAIIADYYGRRFIHALRHPGEYWEWLLLFSAVLLGILFVAFLLNRRLAALSQRSDFNQSFALPPGLRSRFAMRSWMGERR